MVRVRLYYICPVHGRLGQNFVPSAEWDRVIRCPDCGAPAPRDFEHHSIVTIADETYERQP